MPTLNWIGKEKIVNHDKEVPFRLLRKNKKDLLGSYKTANGKAVKVAGLGGEFECVELGKPLFDKDGMIDKEVSFNDLASYIYFTETHTNLEKSKIRKNYLGEYNDVHYFLLFDGVPKKNLLNRKSLNQSILAKA